MDRPPVGDPPADEPERVEAPARRRVRREHEPRARRASRAARRRAGEQRRQPLRGGGAATPRARSRCSAAAARIWRSTWASSARPPSPAAVNSAERLVEPPPVEVRVEVAAGTATGSGPSGRRPTACSRRGSVRAAVAQAEQRVELLHELDRRGAAAQRADVDRVPGGRLGRDLEDRERRCRTGSAGRRSASACLSAHVARRAQRLISRSLEQQRAELGRASARWSTISACGRPVAGRRRRREVRPGRACAGRTDLPT